MELLAEKQRHTDAIRFLAHAMGKAEAVFWAVLASREAAGPNPPAPVGS